MKAESTSRNTTSRQGSTCKTRMVEAEVLPDGTVIFPNLLRDDYKLLEEIGEFKVHEPIEGYEHMFIPHLCA